MRIKTEIIQSMFIVTCEGASLDASLAQEFLTAMDQFFKKSQLDILLDLSAVNFIDSTGLGAIIRSLIDMEGDRQLILCGVNERILDLLKMTYMNNEFTQVPSRNRVLSNLFWERKNNTPAPVVSRTKPPAAREEATIHYDLLDDAPGEEEQRIALKEENPAIPWEVDDFEIEEVTDQADEAAEDLTALHEKRHDSGEPSRKKERRKYRRIEHQQITDEDITIYCKNTVTGKHHMAVVLNISPGGLLLTSPARFSPGDKLLLEGRLGRYFKFKEHAISRSCRKDHYGLEFVNLSMETTHFLNRITGSVDMINTNKLFHNIPR
ncbi:MAG TPA: STAS domain-containing protein [Desulfocapsa sulfexigens]|nr:STAS domain-containing protein [Desulfocapsa sulfexigens]